GSGLGFRRWFLCSPPRRDRMRRMKRLGSVGLRGRVGAVAMAGGLVAAILGATQGVRAQDINSQDDATAKAHFDAGSGHYTAGRFDEAGAEFMKAYELSKRPKLLFNAYLAFRDGGNDVWAAKVL